MLGGRWAAQVSTEPLDSTKMSSREFTKGEKKKLRALAREAYARDLDQALRELDSGFSDWRRKQIDGFQLTDLIHEFHQGPSRELYLQYERLDPGFLVARAVARGLLRTEEIPSSIASVLSPLILYCRESYEDQDE